MEHHLKLAFFRLLYCLISNSGEDLITTTMVAGAVGAALKKKGTKSHGKSGPTFYTPARHGWGQVARELHPDMAQVSIWR